MSPNDVCQLWSLVDGERGAFPTTVSLNWTVDELLRAIQQERYVLQDVDIMDLVLYKLTPMSLLSNGFRRRSPIFLSSWTSLRLNSEVFPDRPEGHLQIIVVLPVERQSKRRKVEIEDEAEDEDSTLASLKSLWNCAWGKPDSEAKLFETRKVTRDGTLPKVITPKKYRVLTIPTSLLKPFAISTILIRQEYVIALKFAIFIAEGGDADNFVVEENDEGDDEWGSTMLPNPFILPLAQTRIAAVCYLGHPGIGKTLFLFFVLVLRILQSLPSIYMVHPDCMYIINSEGVKKILTKRFRESLVTNKYWSLVDSNRKLETVPPELIETEAFLIQTASPRAVRTDWWKKANRPRPTFFMKEWSLPDLIVGATLQAQCKASENHLNTFLDDFIPSAREVFVYADRRSTYERLVLSELAGITRKGIQRMLHSARALNFDDGPKVSPHVVLITPEKNRIDHRVDIPTRFLYDKMKELGKLHALEAAYMLYQTFKAVKQTTPSAGLVYEDLIRYQLPLGGQWPVITPQKTPKKIAYIHFLATGTEEAKTYLCLGQNCDTPFQFTTALPSNSQTFNNLKRISYPAKARLVLETGFYFPLSITEATFDGFVYDAKNRVAIVFQVTVGKKHTVKLAGLQWLKSLGVKKVYYVGVTPIGQGLDLPFDPDWLGFVEGVYQLPLEPPPPKTLPLGCAWYRLWSPLLS